MTTAIFYGSATGTTADLARDIVRAIGDNTVELFDVGDTAPSMLGNYERLILGSSTHGSGELEDDWFDFIAGAEELDLSGKTIALFGAGDETMADTFCDAVGILRERLDRTGAKFTGYFTTEPYSYRHSRAVKDGPDNPARIACGLLIDQVNHPDLTADRIARWVKTI